MSMVSAFESILFRRRRIVLALFALGTVFMAWQATGLFIDAGFEKLLPLKHPFMQTFLQYQQEFGGANKCRH